MKKLMIALLALALLLAGCASEKQTLSLSDQGTLLLSVNPEIEIKYNGEGRVTALTGRNDDGRAIVAQYDDYIGKPCQTVLHELVEEIYDAGYFIEEIEGQQKNIVLQIEAGSALPSDDFMERMSDEVRTTVQELTLSSNVVTIDRQDYAAGNRISAEKAKEIALAQAGLSEASFRECELDEEDGIYELEFWTDEAEYEYEIDAVTGKVRKAECKRAQQPAPSTNQTLLSVAEAKNIALSHAEIALGDASFRHVELDEEDCRYEIEFTARGLEYEYEIDAVSGTVCKAEHEPCDNDYHHTPTTVSNYLSLEEAKSAALTAAGVDAASATFTKAELDREDGIFELEFCANGLEYEYEINAVSGAVCKAEHEACKHSNHHTASSTNYISVEEAKSAALAAAGVDAASATFTKAELDREDGIFELEFCANGLEYEYEINAVSSAVCKAEHETCKHSNHHTASSTNYISVEEAKSAALAAAGVDAASATFTKAELDREDGVFELEFCANGLEYEYEINAVSGAVCKAEHEACDHNGHHHGG